MGDPSGNRNNENASYLVKDVLVKGKAKEKDHVRDRVREWEREKERLREMEKLAEIERERDEKIEEEKEKATLKATLEAENRRVMAAPTPMTSPAGSSLTSGIIRSVSPFQPAPDSKPTDSDLLPSVANDSSLNVFRHNIRKSIGWS